MLEETERLAHQEGGRCLGGIIDANVANAFLGKIGCEAFGGVLIVAVHRAVDNHDALRSGSYVDQC